MKFWHSEEILAGGDLALKAIKVGLPAGEGGRKVQRSNSNPGCVGRMRLR